MGYDLVLWNFDQTPHYQNEVVAQNKPTLAVRGATVPTVEGKSAAHARWTALLSCCSSEEVIRQRWPFCEAMYKYKDCGPKERELQGHIRDQNYPRWLSVTVAPKGTYRESDIVDMLERHLPLWGPDRRIEIMISDDFSAHRTENVKNRQWERCVSQWCWGGDHCDTAALRR